VEEPPEENDECHNDQTEGLVAAKGTTLLFAQLILGQLLLIRLDAAFDHACVWVSNRNPRCSPRISIGIEGLRRHWPFDFTHLDCRPLFFTLGEEQRKDSE
jgi:hypothetical protein